VRLAAIRLHDVNYKRRLLRAKRSGSQNHERQESMSPGWDHGGSI